MKTENCIRRRIYRRREGRSELSSVGLKRVVGRLPGGRRSGLWWDGCRGTIRSILERFDVHNDTMRGQILESHREVREPYFRFESWYRRSREFIHRKRKKYSCKVGVVVYKIRRTL